MAIRAPERTSFSLFRRLSENPASGGTQLTRFARVFGAAALLAVAAGCGSAGYEPNGRRLGGSDVVSPDGAVGPGPDIGEGDDDGGDADVGGPKPDSGTADAGRRDGGENDAGSRPDGGNPDAGGAPDAGPDAGTDGGTPPVCPVETCREGIGACEQVGRILYDADCIPTGCSVSGGEPAPAEDCGNALDDDCNGEINNGCACDPDTDESTACYTGGEDTRSQGICHDGNSTCGSDGRWGPCEDQQTPLEEEICGNGLNEDCDLETDEGCGGGVECSAGEGICRTAGVTRADGSCDAVPGLPEETDLCGDGLDNDCVNGIDDGCVCPAESIQLCYQGGVDTLNVGVCRPGTQTCIDDGRRWSPVCDGQVLPSAEQCNGEDDNCNDETDENLTRPCFTDCGEGTEVCRDGSFQDCNAPQPRPEACNGADDDCNDRIDEDIAPRVCSTICGEGTEVCRDGAFRDCNAPTPQEEVCNGADDDCDDVTDEGCPCTAGRGICERDGVVQPDGNCSAVPGDPGIEICNGADDNCNGETDETFPEQDQPCTVGQGACENNGFVVCTDPALGAHCNVLPGTPNDEECNGIDDDCNNIIDDGAPPGDPASETCNSADDDCDGLTDEENAAGCSDFFRDFDGDTYGTAESRCICAPEGEFTAARSGDCADGNPAVNPEAAEVVNQIDDNCNIWIDESPAGYDVMCDDAGGSANVTPNGQPAHACAVLRPEMVSIPADVVSSAVYNTRFGADGQRRAVLTMLVPIGAPGFNSIVAQDTSTGFGLSVGLNACPADLPVAPAGRETRCYRSPDEPGGIATPVRFNITP